MKKTAKSKRPARTAGKKGLNLKVKELSATDLKSIVGGNVVDGSCASCCYHSTTASSKG